MITRLLIAIFALMILPGLVCPLSAEAIIADHESSADFETIPANYFDQVRAEYQFYYGHTSHGSQIMTGLDMLEAEDGVLYAQPAFSEYGDDLGHAGDTSWVAPTRAYLDTHPECNTVMWSWCGGCSDNSEEGINIYLNAINGLEIEYPNITFIYMTGHLDGSGPEGTLYARNNQIRDYCNLNDKILFDFADIESYDPDGNYYPDESDYCNWCYDWCAVHSCPSCGSCAHSHCFNCYQKGKAFWWMMARVDGWQAVEDSIPHIVSTSPGQNELNIAVNANILVTFDIDMNETTINDTTFIVHARSTGLHDGTFSYNAGNQTMTFNPDEDFAIGEMVSVTLTDLIESSEGFYLADGYSWNFITAVNSGNAIFDNFAEYPTSEFPVPDGPLSVFAGNLNNDDNIDLAVANGSMNTMSVLHGNGDCTFQSFIEFPVMGSNGVVSVTGADLNGDGHLDLAVANLYSNSITVLFNDGSGIFGTQMVYAAGLGPRSVCAADLDDDGDIDLAVSNEGSDNVSVLLNYGDGTFAGQSTYPAGNDARSVCASDFDNDGDFDLAVANSLSDNVSVLMNNGDGSFAGQVLYDVGAVPRSIISRDFNADGYSDLAVANAFDDNISILINNGSGDFAAHSTYSIGFYAWPVSIFAADFDNDGNLDLATANDQSDNVSVFLNDGAGIFSIDSSYATDDYPYSVYSADFDSDGDMDLASANYEGQNVSILMNSNDDPLYQYLPGDVNMRLGLWPPTVIGGDVTYLVGYFRGMPTNIPCYLDGFWASADVNRDCMIIGSDVTKMIGVFRGMGSMNWCDDYPPAWQTPDDLSEEAPSGWPNCEETPVD
ncbi:MAG: hypothetical protein GY839_04985 [candidate division Zixibacteria bacterium]|nr:hypothetical protein [candidate division Zixibacteria bacterium]